MIIVLTTNYLRGNVSPLYTTLHLRTKNIEIVDLNLIFCEQDMSVFEDSYIIHLTFNSYKYTLSMFMTPK